MKKMLHEIKCGSVIHIGNFVVYASSDGAITARQDGSGLMAPPEPPTGAGLRRVLAWIDEGIE